MKVLIDTSVWSLALRKKKITKNKKMIVRELTELIHELRALIIGPIRQELLSGIAAIDKFNDLKSRLRAFDDITLKQEDYEKAAEIYNGCRKKGIQGSHIDFLICGVALNHGISIFTTDKDFENFEKVTKIKLHTVREDIMR